LNPISVMDVLGGVRGVQRVTLLRGTIVLGNCGTMGEGDVPDMLHREQLEQLLKLGSNVIPGGVNSVCGFIGNEIHQILLFRGYTFHVVLRGAMILTHTLSTLLESYGVGDWNFNEAMDEGFIKNRDDNQAKERAMSAAQQLVDRIKVIPAGELAEEQVITTETHDVT